MVASHMCSAAHEVLMDDDTCEFGIYQTNEKVSVSVLHAYHNSCDASTDLVLKD
jgi:hypothetical protein